MMQSIPDSFVPSESGEYDTFDDGEYTVQCFDWTSTSDNDRPILVSQKDGRMIGRLNFKLESGDEGPPYSLELRAMPVLVLAFGGDVEKLPERPELDNPGKISAYMDAVQSLCITGNTTVVHVQEGWVRWVVGMEVVGKYQFVLEDLWPKDDNGEPELKEGKYGFFTNAYFRVTTGEGGSPTKYKDAYFREYCPYAVVVNEVNGEPVVDWKRTKVKKEFTSEAVRFSNLMRYTAPVMFEDGYVIANPYNLFPEWLREAKNKNLELKGERIEKDGKAGLDWSTLEPVLPTVISVPEVKPQEPELVLVDAKAREQLKALLSLLAGGEAFVGDTFDITPLGRETAKQYLGPLKKAGVLTHGVIKDLTFDEVQTIFERIPVPDEHKEGFTKLRHQLAAIGVRVDEEEVF